MEADCPNGDPTAESSFRILPNGYVTPSTYLLDADWQVKRLDEIDNIDSMHELDSFKKLKLLKYRNLVENVECEKSVRVVCLIEDGCGIMIFGK